MPIRFHPPANHRYGKRRHSVEHRLEQVLWTDDYFAKSLEPWQLEHVRRLMQAAYNMGRHDEHERCKADKVEPGEIKFKTDYIKDRKD